MKEEKKTSRNRSRSFSSCLIKALQGKQSTERKDDTDIIEETAPELRNIQRAHQVPIRMNERTTANHIHMKLQKSNLEVPFVAQQGKNPTECL